MKIFTLLSGKPGLKHKIIIISTLLILCTCLAIYVVTGNLHTALPIGKPITLGTSLSYNSALLLLAEEKGFFKKNNVLIKIKIYPSAGLGLEDMLNDSIQICAAAETPLMYQRFQRDDFKIFSTICTNNNDPKIVVQKRKAINTPAGLAGKKIGTTRRGQSANFFLYLFLLKNHIDYTEVFIIHDSPAAVRQKLLSGVIDGAALFEPHVYHLQKELQDNVIIFEEPGLYLKTFNLAAKTDYIHNNKDSIKALLRALIDAENYLINFPEEALTIISRRLNTPLSEIEEYMSHSSFEVTLHRSLMETLVDEAKWAVDYNITGTEELPDYSALFYSETLEQINPARVTLFHYKE